MHKIGLGALMVYHHGSNLSREFLIICEKLDLYLYRNQLVVSCYSASVYSFISEGMSEVSTGLYTCI